MYELGRDGDLHEHFYTNDSKYYHLFVYSSLIGEHKYESGKHIFEGPVRLEFSSPVNDFCMAVASRILNTPVHHIGNQDVKIKSIMSLEEPEFKSPMYFEAASPITVHKTVMENEKRKTVYFTPFEKEFSEYIKNNLLRKYEAFTGKSVSNPNFNVEAVKVEPRDQKILMYEKNQNRPFVIKGWTGTYKLEGDIELIKFAYRSGLGARNSQGFGFLKDGKENKRL